MIRRKVAQRGLAKGSLTITLTKNINETSLGFVGLEYPLTKGLHEAFLQNGKLSSDQNQRLSNLIDSPKVVDTKFSYPSLMLAYTHSYWLTQCIEKGQKKLKGANYERLLSFREQLFKKWCLSNKQIECLNADLKFVLKEHAPILDSECFAPYRPQQKSSSSSASTPAPEKS